MRPLSKHNISRATQHPARPTPPDAFTEAQLREADHYLAGPARDPQFFNRRTELYEQRRQREAERLELQQHQEVV